MPTVTGPMIAKYLDDHDDPVGDRDTCEDVAFSLDLFLTDFGKPGRVRAIITKDEKKCLKSADVQWVYGLSRQNVYYDSKLDMLYIVPKN